MDIKKLPIYTSHKSVRAAKIIGIEHVSLNPGTIERLHLELPDNMGVESLEADQHPGLFRRYTPKEGDYLLVYRDGYVSICPKTEFEDGYHRTEEGLAIARFEQAEAEHTKQPA